MVSTIDIGKGFVVVSFVYSWKVTLLDFGGVVGDIITVGCIFVILNNVDNILAKNARGVEGCIRRLIICFIIVGHNVLVWIDGDLLVLEKCEAVVVLIVCGRIFFGVFYGFDL